MAEIPCAELVLSQLPHEVLNGIKTICSTAKQGLQIIKTEYQAINVSIDIDLFPQMAKKAVLDKLISEARAKSKIIPTEMVVQCPQLGAINTTVEAALVGQIENIANIVFDIARLTSVKASFSAQIDEIDTALDFLDSVVDSINQVLGG